MAAPITGDLSPLNGATPAVVSPDPDTASATPAVASTSAVAAAAISPPSSAPKNPDIKAPWHTRTIVKLEQHKTALNKIPDLAVQKKIDLISQHIKNKFAPLKGFNDWLNTNGEGEWYTKLATYLVKLPARSIRNIIQLLYKIISGVLSFGVHPLVGSLELAQLMVKLVHSLTLPETYSKMGVGIMGSALGQAVIVPSPVAYIGLIIGAALSISGLSLGILKTASQAKPGKKITAVKGYLAKLLPELPEVFLTAFAISAAITGIRQAIIKSQPVAQQYITQTQADQFAQDYALKNNIPAPTSVVIAGDGNVVMSWEGQDIVDLIKEVKELRIYSHPDMRWIGAHDEITLEPPMHKCTLTIPHDDPTLATVEISKFKYTIDTHDYINLREGEVPHNIPIEEHHVFQINNANAPLPLTSPEFPQIPIDPTLVDLAIPAAGGIPTSNKA